MTTCDQWRRGFWTRSVNLREKRVNHVSWATASGLYLMGGSYSSNTSELVKKDGSVKEGLILKYETAYGNK